MLPGQSPNSDFDNEVRRLQAEARARGEQDGELVGPLAALEHADRSHSPLRIIVASLAGLFGLVIILDALVSTGGTSGRIVNTFFGACFIYWSVLAYERKRSAYRTGLYIGILELAVGLFTVWADGSNGGLALVAVLMLAGVWFSRDTFDRD